MKVLIFEYITGGGLNKQELPGSLLREGHLMLVALLENFSRLNGVEPVVMLDARLTGVVDLSGMATMSITVAHDSFAEFERLTRQCDAVWPIAPEFDGLLEAFCRSVAAQGRLLLSSPASAVAIAGNKYATYQCLSWHHIPTVPTRRLCEVRYEPGEWMVKSIDGAGCADSFLVICQQDFAGICATQLERFIIQPHLQGQKISLSCLFKNGHAWLISVNLQRFQLINKRYQLEEIIVNYRSADYQYPELIGRIAGAFPDLWGYVGIDLIETSEQLLVLEINPRLTTSFVGIFSALGINVAEQVLQLLESEPCLHSRNNQSVSLKIQ